MTSRNLSHRVVLATILFVASLPAQSTEPVTKWIRANAVRLTTPQRGAVR